MKIERRETMSATMQPDMYDGPTCDQMRPRWYCFADGDKQADYQDAALELDPKLFPPGTRVVVFEPICPQCKETREPNYKNGKYLPGFAAKCRCGFDWEAWTANEYC